MIVRIKKASFEQKPTLGRLMQLYLYDFSEIDPSRVDESDVNQDGLFVYHYFDSYWSEPDRFPFLIYVEDKIAGFVLVAAHSYYLQEKGEAKSIAEFFVMRKYRRQGIGRTAAFHIFDMFPGKWEVHQMKANIGGQQFWRRVIGEYTGGDFTETFLDNEPWQGPIQVFDNSHKFRTASEGG